MTSTSNHEPHPRGKDGRPKPIDDRKRPTAGELLSDEETAHPDEDRGTLTHVQARDLGRKHQDAEAEGRARPGEPALNSGVGAPGSRRDDASAQTLTPDTSEQAGMSDRWRPHARLGGFDPRVRKRPHPRRLRDGPPRGVGSGKLAPVLRVRHIAIEARRRMAMVSRMADG